MPSLKDIRKRIGSVKNTQQITKAMKMVAAARLRKAQEAIETARPYSYPAARRHRSARRSLRLLGPPALEQREPKRVHLLVMTSDRGLCGGFNATINRATERYIRENPRGHEQITLDIVGRKGNEYFKRRETPISSYFREILTQVSLESASDIAEKAIVSFVEGELDALYVVYNEFKSAISQEVRIEQLLPVTPAESAEQGELAEFIYEPSKEQVMDAVLPRHITVQIYRQLLESVASEMGARMSAMDSATKNAGELIDRSRSSTTAPARPTSRKS
jgi:F-type H+-transporting ATPase subunit gamma